MCFAAKLDAGFHDRGIAAARPRRDRSATTSRTSIWRRCPRGSDRPIAWAQAIFGCWDAMSVKRWMQQQRQSLLIARAALARSAVIATRRLARLDSRAFRPTTRRRTRRTPHGPMLMGACRGLNVIARHVEHRRVVCRLAEAPSRCRLGVAWLIVTWRWYPLYRRADDRVARTLGRRLSSTRFACVRHDALLVGACDPGVLQPFLQLGWTEACCA